MGGNSMFTIQLSNCLKDLKCSKDNFGGASIITLGDLFQLKFVMDCYVFSIVPCVNSYYILVSNLRSKYCKMLSCDKEIAKCLRRFSIDFLKAVIHLVIFKNRNKDVLKKATVLQKNRGSSFKMC